MRASILLVVVVAACFSPKFRSDIACSDFANATDCPPGYGCITPGTAGPSSAICLPATKCPIGIYCPIPLQCGDKQPICLTSPCGNGVKDPDEECDDGNIVDNDGCDHDCHIERCGNGKVEPERGEVCDLGMMNGMCMGCSADCKSFERCGDGILDTQCGEVCDNGPNPTNQCNGCDAQCKSNQTCGNGIVDPECNEVCDPPNGSSCAPGCHSAAACGNGILDPGEECDNGLANNNNNADCRADCIVNRCGDGHPNMMGPRHHEDCDGAPPAPPGTAAAAPVETAGCNLDCTLAVCGDGKVNGHAGEECDPPNAATHCNASCKLTVCP